MAISCTKISFSTGFFSINTSSKRSFSFTRSMHGNRIKVWVPQVTWVMWYLVFVRLETVLASMQNSCTVCAKRTIWSKIVLDAPDATPR
jgi:hypothetical protein